MTTLQSQWHTVDFDVCLCALSTPLCVDMITNYASGRKEYYTMPPLQFNVSYAHGYNEISTSLHMEQQNNNTQHKIEVLQMRRRCSKRPFFFSPLLLFSFFLAKFHIISFFL